MLSRKVTNIAAVLAFVCFGSGFGAAVWQASHAPRANIKQEQAKELNGDTTATKERVTPEEALARYTCWLMGFTGVLAASTVGLWFATIGLYRAGERSARRQQRAYVHVTDATIIYTEGDWCPNIRITIKNFGQTPAYDVQNSANCALVMGRPKFNDLPQVNKRSDLGPGQGDVTTTIIVGRGMWQQMMKPAIEKSFGVFYVYGHISYRDTFGDYHLTKYRYEVHGDAEGVKDGGLIFSPEGNESN